jgi:hypothetical protein
MRADDESCLHFFTMRAILNAPFWMRVWSHRRSLDRVKMPFSMYHFVGIKFWLRRDRSTHAMSIISRLFLCCFQVSYWALQTLERYLEAAYVQANRSLDEPQNPYFRQKPLILKTWEHFILYSGKWKVRAWPQDTATIDKNRVDSYQLEIDDESIDYNWLWLLKVNLNVITINGDSEI